MANYTPSTPNNFLAVRAELDKIAIAIEGQLDRDGTAPNFMESDLDMNGFSILNENAEDSNTVSSVFGRTGDVVAEAGDYNQFYLQDISTQDIGTLNDVSITGIQFGDLLSWDGNQFVPVPSGGTGVSSFAELTDTPNTYAGNQGKALIVDPTESGLLFTDSLDDLIDTVDGGSF